ncbi:MAG: SIS domain-containing protein [Planctomycetota bacterium]
MTGVRAALPLIDRIAQAIESTLRAGGKVLTCGNGGSAAEALHFSEEMIGRFSKDRPPLATVCLASDSTVMTCISNDFGFEQVFARQVVGLGRKGDALVALTTSGKSKNVLLALQEAKTAGLMTIGLLGPPGSQAESLCDIAFTLSGVESSHVQEAHLLVIHLVLEHLDHVFG